MALIDFFNPNAPQGSTFNYGTEADKIKRKRALAQQLMGAAFQPNRTDVVPGGHGGFAVPQSSFSTLAKVLQTGIGTYMDKDLDKSQGDLDTRSQDELVKALSDEPWKDRARQGQLDREAEAELLREGRRGSGVEAGEQVSTGAETYPVRDATVETRPLPVASVAQKLQAPVNPANRVGTEKGRATNTSAASPVAPSVTPEQALQQAKRELREDPAAATLSVGMFNTLVQQRQREIMAAQLQGKPVLQPAAPQPQAAPPVPAPMPPTAAQAPQAPQGPMPVNPMAPPQPMQPPPAAPQPTPSGPIGDARSMVDQAAASASPTQADAIKQIIRIANTGPMGQQVANGMFAQTFGAKANEFDFVTVKDSNGAESVLAVNKRNPAQRAVVYQGSSAPSVAERRLQHDIDKDTREAGIKANERETASQTAAGDLASTYRSFKSLVYPEKGQDGIASASGWFDNLAAKVPGTDAQRVQDMAKRDLSKLVLSFMQQLQANGAGVSAFNSDMESKRLEQAAASINWTNEASATQAAKDILTQMEATGNRLNDARARQGMSRLPMPWEQSAAPKASAAQYGFGDWKQ